MNYAALLAFKSTIINARQLRHDLRLRFPGISFSVAAPELRQLVIQWQAGPSVPLVTQVAQGLLPGSMCSIEPRRLS